MRRTHLRGHENILKRLLIHISGFNLGLVMRNLLGYGTPRGLQGRRFLNLLKPFLAILRDIARSNIWYRLIRYRNVTFRNQIAVYG